MKKSKRGFRIRFSEDEKKHDWLPMLLDAYAVVDKGISEAIRAKEKSDSVKLACGRGCGSCCTSQKDIPVYPMELTGIYWYVLEKISEPLRSRLKERLAGFQSEVRCPFLLDGACATHLVRPVGCRLFNVFRTPCEEGEDPYYTRPQDVLMPPREIADRAFFIMMPFYGITDERAREDMIRTGLIHTHARVIRSLNWKELAGRM